MDVDISVTLALRNIKMYERFKCNEIRLIFVLHTIKNGQQFTADMLDGYILCNVLNPCISARLLVYV